MATCIKEKETTCLSRENPLVDFVCGGIVARYQYREYCDERHYDKEILESIELTLLPLSKYSEEFSLREFTPLHPSVDSWGDTREQPANTHPDQIVSLALRGEKMASGFTAGMSMHYSGTTEKLCFLWQQADVESSAIHVQTCLRTHTGIECIHHLKWKLGWTALCVYAEVINGTDHPQVLEHISSFCINGLSPYQVDDASECMAVHRFQSCWSAEGRHTVASLESLHLERSWECAVRSLRFGQTGSMPVRGYFPWLGLEDRQSGVFWGATLAWHGSWQMEVCRRQDSVTLTGGLADYDYGHWAKTLQPREHFETPEAWIAVVCGEIDELSQALLSAHGAHAWEEPEPEKALPIVFNEWCTSWGNPTHKSVMAAAQKLKNTHTRYLVIDDGWSMRPEHRSFQQNGDWVLKESNFPHGLLATSRAIREQGMIPGIWFEFEIATDTTQAFQMSDHMLTRHGKVLQVGNRRFWDFRDPFTRKYLQDRMISFLKKYEFGYLKIDYNDSIGIGCDSPDGLGEGLREHLQGVEAFLREVRQELPDLVIENCSSGGHRLVVNMVGLTSMSSFSDAHETVEVPLIAASLHRLIPAAKSQIWCVLRSTDTLRRIHYSLAATFLGRMCLSGDLFALSDATLKEVVKAQTFYQLATPVIREGNSRIYQHTGESWRYPKGWQAVVRATDCAALIVIHTFGESPAGHVSIPLPQGQWQFIARYNDNSAWLDTELLHLNLEGDFIGKAVLLKRIK